MTINYRPEPTRQIQLTAWLTVNDGRRMIKTTEIESLEISGAGCLIRTTSGKEWQIHGHTPSEIAQQIEDAVKASMGLT